MGHSRKRGWPFFLSNEQLNTAAAAWPVGRGSYRAAPRRTSNRRRRRRRRLDVRASRVRASRVRASSFEGSSFELRGFEPRPIGRWPWTIAQGSRLKGLGSSGSILSLYQIVGNQHQRSTAPQGSGAMALALFSSNSTVKKHID